MDFNFYDNFYTFKNIYMLAKDNRSDVCLISDNERTMTSYLNYIINSLHKLYLNNDVDNLDKHLKILNSHNIISSNIDDKFCQSKIQIDDEILESNEFNELKEYFLEEFHLCEETNLVLLKIGMDKNKLTDDEYFLRFLLGIYSAFMSSHNNRKHYFMFLNKTSSDDDNDDDDFNDFDDDFDDDDNFDDDDDDFFDLMN